MARLGKRERLAKRNYETALRLRTQGYVSRNLSTPKPAKSLLSRDETAALQENTHTRGIQIGQRSYTILKHGSPELAANKRKW